MKRLRDVPKVDDPSSDCQCCRLNYWLSRSMVPNEAFRLAEKKRMRAEESN